MDAEELSASFAEPARYSRPFEVVRVGFRALASDKQTSACKVRMWDGSERIGNALNGSTPTDLAMCRLPERSRAS